MRKTLILLSLFIASSLMAQNTNSSTDLLKQGFSKRKAKKEQKEKKDKELYWLGKVPVKDGKVVFEKIYNLSGKNQEQIYDNMYSFISRLIEDSKHSEVSHVALEDKTQGNIMASIGETMYFKRGKWESDFTNFYYQINVECTNEKCTVTIKDIQYRYEEQHEVKGEYLKAEEWITDNAAFNKDKTKILKEPFKFRRETIQRINAIFDAIEKTLQ